MSSAALLRESSPSKNSLNSNTSDFRTAASTADSERTFTPANHGPVTAPVSTSVQASSNVTPSALEIGETPAEEASTPAAAPASTLLPSASHGHLTHLASPMSQQPPSAVCNASDAEFDAIVEEVRTAIRHGIQPVRISRGSSGSYFVRARSGQIVGVFKPKDEEPYGQFNPKWTKWLHKTILPCCFGRSCLIPNLGYASEAAASVVDRVFQMGIVPRTDIVELASPAFYYGPADRRRANKKLKQLQKLDRPMEDADLDSIYPKKLGSLQLFLNGYQDASVFLRRVRQEPLPVEAQIQFQKWFERLVILDYLIRNTDRGDDNWMIYFGYPSQTTSPRPASVSSDLTPTQWQLLESPQLHIAAIDHGLAFPFKHPDNWRSYPYAWCQLPAARVPFSEESRQYFLEQMQQDRTTWPRLVTALCDVFRQDSDFDVRLFRRQLAVVRGQYQNLMDILAQPGSTPLDLVSRPRLVVYESRARLKSAFRILRQRSVAPRDEAARFLMTAPASPVHNDGATAAVSSPAPADADVDACTTTEDEDCSSQISSEQSLETEAVRRDVIQQSVGSEQPVRRGTMHTVRSRRPSVRRVRRRLMKLVTRQPWFQGW